MTIDCIELRHIRMPFVLPFEDAGSREDFKVCFLVRAWAGGISGWGESPVSTRPFNMEETVEAAWPAMTRFLGPRVLGRPFRHPREVAEWLRPIRRHRLRSGLEAAAWDLYAQAQGISLAHALGGTRTRVAAGMSVGLEQTIDATLRRIETWLASGYQRIKTKIKPGWDVELVAAIRRRFGNIPLQVDANATYTLRDLPRLQALDANELLMIEQPLDADDLIDHAALQQELRTPVCLDESIRTADDARKALDLGACRIINVKAARMGGLSEAQRCHALCHDRGVPLWCGGLLETGVGRAANIALASLPGFTLPADLGASRRYFQEDVIDPEVEVAPDGTVAVPSGAGLGFTVLEPVVDRYTVRKETLRAG